jgi:hypothetical protein
VISVRTPGEYGDVSALPPAEFTNQPLKVYPVRVGLVGSEIEPSVVNVAEETADPPCESKETVWVSAFHFANSVTSVDEIEKVAEPSER